jgi:predicted NAD/FAD-dependent oxidoreductase
MTDVGFVGAGAATAAANYVLDSELQDANVTILEKSGGLCGRAATRRRGDVTYDYGANYVTSDDPLVVELLTDILDTDGLFDIQDPIHTFDADGTVSKGRDSKGQKWSYERGLTQIAKRLFARTDATVHRNTRVTELDRDEQDKVWRATDANGDQWGPFDALVLNPPAPQTASLLENTVWKHSLRTELVNNLRGIEYRTIISAIMHYPFEIDRPFYALVNPENDHEIGWIAREECKHGHVPNGESLLVVQANHQWSVDHYDDPPTDTVPVLAELTADILSDDRLLTPDWTDYHGWRYAFPKQGAPPDRLAAAEAHDLYCIGDWVAGEPRLHAALRSGLDTAKRLAELER